MDVTSDGSRAGSARAHMLQSGRDFEIHGSDTILEAALHAGLSVNYGCSTGNCGLCRARIVSGETVPVHPYDYHFTDAEKSAGYVLMCCHAPASDLVIDANEARRPEDIPHQTIPTKVRTVSALTDKVTLLQVQTPRSNQLRFMAGQWVHVSIGEADGEYPVASCPCDGNRLEFHVRNIPDDPFAEKVFAGMRTGETVEVNGPFGDFVLNEDSTRPILFLACNSGFAQVASLIQHAMALEQSDPIHLYWLATHPSGTGHYRANQCRSWADALDTFRYTELVKPSVTEANVHDAFEEIARTYPDLSGYDAYIAGPYSFLSAGKAWLLAHGMAADHISGVRA